MIRRMQSLLIVLLLTCPVALAQEHSTPAPAASAVETHASEGQPGAHGGGHHGPAVKLFGSKGPELGPFGQWAVKAFNFAIFAGALVFALKGLLATAFKARAKELEARLTQAERDKAEGEVQIKNLEAKMVDLQAELDDILAKAAAEAESERSRIVTQARAEAEAILAQARFDIDVQFRQAEKDLRALVADLAVDGARARLQARLVGEQAQRTMDQAIAQVGGAQ